MKRKECNYIGKIEIDDKTKEPKIVEIPLENNPAETPQKHAQKQVVSTYTKEEHKKFKKEIGKQLVMNQMLGFDNDSQIDSRKKLFKNIFTIVFITLMVAVIGYTFYNDFIARGEQFSWIAIGDTVKNNLHYLLLAITALLMTFVLKGFKLSCTCKSLTGRFRFKTCVETGIVGHYYNNVTPLAVGGQPFEVLHLSKRGIAGGTATSIVISTYFMNQFGFVSVGIFSIVALAPSVNLLNLSSGIIDSSTILALRPLAIIGLSFCAMMPLLIILFSVMPRICAKLVKFILGVAGKLKLVKKPELTTYKTIKQVFNNSRCLKKLAKRPLVLILSYLVSLAEQVASCSIAYFILKFFGFNWNTSFCLEWLQIISICTLINAAVSFVPTPGNTGAADISFYWMFSYSIVPGLAFTAMLTWRLLGYYSYLLIGFIFVVVKKKSDHKKEMLGLPLYKE